jgi:hypothetical protein
MTSFMDVPMTRFFDLQVVTQEHPLETEIDFEEEFIHDDDDLSSDSDVAIVTLDQATDAIDSSYLVKKLLKLPSF